MCVIQVDARTNFIYEIKGLFVRVFEWKNVLSVDASCPETLIFKCLFRCEITLELIQSKSNNIMFIMPPPF